jgi:hypothetical protein
MQNYISFISIRFNSSVDESLCVGLIYLKGDEVEIKVSDLKMKLVKKIFPKKNIFNAFKFAITQMQRNKDVLNYKQIERLHIYQNGIVKIDKPKPISADITDSFFHNIIEKNFIND